MSAEYGTCKFNKGVECLINSNLTCAACGWNPEVALQRKRKETGKIQLCLHCGGVATSHLKDGLYYVQCGKCGISTMGFKKKNMAIFAWNRRASV